MTSLMGWHQPMSHMGQANVSIKKTPQKETIRSWLSVNQKVGPHQTPSSRTLISDSPTSRTVRNKCLGFYFNFYLFSFSFNLLRRHWLTLYRFQAHSSTTHHLDTVLCVHQPQSSLLHPSPCIPPLPAVTAPCP